MKSQKRDMKDSVLSNAGDLRLALNDTGLRLIDDADVMWMGDCFR